MINKKFREPGRKDLETLRDRMEDELNIKFMIFYSIEDSKTHFRASHHSKTHLYLDINIDDDNHIYSCKMEFTQDSMEDFVKSEYVGSLQDVGTQMIKYIKEFRNSRRGIK